MDFLQLFGHDYGLWDAVCLLVLLLSALIGLWRGVVHEALALVVWLSAFVGAQWGAWFVQQALSLRGQGSWLLAFVLVFVALLAVGVLVRHAVRALVHQAGLGGVDRVLGLVFGVARALVLLWAVTVLVLLTPLHQGAWWQQAQASVWLTQSLRWAAPLLPAPVQPWIPPHLRSPLPPRGSVAAAYSAFSCCEGLSSCAAS